MIGVIVQHVQELELFFSGISLEHLVVQRSERKSSTIPKLCYKHVMKLRTIWIENTTMWERWSFGDLAPASWEPSVEAIPRHPGILQCTLKDLVKKNLNNLTGPWKIGLPAQNTKQVTNFSATGFAHVSVGLQNLLTSTQW